MWSCAILGRGSQKSNNLEVHSLHLFSRSNIYLELVYNVLFSGMLKYFIEFNFIIKGLQ